MWLFMGRILDDTGRRRARAAILAPPIYTGDRWRSFRKALVSGWTWIAGVLRVTIKFSSSSFRLGSLNLYSYLRALSDAVMFDRLLCAALDHCRAGQRSRIIWSTMPDERIHDAEKRRL